MERNQLAYAVELARRKSFTRAAEALHITQPSLSNQIKALERELGIPLFERSKRHVEVTEAGERFVTEAQRILNDFDALGELMGDYAACRAGRLRLGAIATMCSLDIPTIIASFQEKYPGVHVTLIEKGGAELLDALALGEIDAAFTVSATLANRSHRKDPNGYEANSHVLKIRSSDVCVAINREDPRAMRSTISDKELADAPFIASTGEFALQRETFAALGIAQPEEPMFRCNQIDSCLALANEGLGVTLATQDIADYYGYPSLSLVPLVPRVVRTVQLRWKRDPASHALLASFIAWTREFYRAAK